MAFSFRSSTWARTFGRLAAPPTPPGDERPRGEGDRGERADGQGGDDLPDGAPRGGRRAMDRSQEAEMERMTWEEICAHEELRGRWVALDGCRYDEVTGKATEGAVVDVDDDLAELCSRIRDSEWKNCAILFCAQGDERPSAASRH
jgi:hypothetical protein